MEEKLIFLRVSELNIDVLSQGLSELHFLVRGQKLDSGHWKWRYLRNPVGKSILLVAIRGSRVVGLYGGPYLLLTVQGRKVIGGLMADFIIHPSERSWRCFRSLVEMYMAETQKDNVAFHFGVVYSNLAKLSQQLGAVSLGRLPIYLGFLNIPRVLEGRSVPYPLSLAGWFLHPVMGLRNRRIRCIDLDIQPIERFDNAFDELWSSIVENRSIAINKDAAYLNWRYGECPGLQFGRLAAYRKKRLEGLVTFRVTGLRNGSLMLELMARDDNSDIMKALVLQVILELRAQRIGHITASFIAGSRAAAVLKELGFKPWGARYWNTPEIIVATPPKESCPELNLKNWNPSLGDYWS